MTDNLFKELKLGKLELKNRILMAPMTRSRSSVPGEVPNALMAKYYGQRASAGIIISEATQISKQGQGYELTPGIHSKEQVEGWKLVTNEVHEKGSKIVLQLWHVGRVSSSKVNGLQPVGPSAISAAETSVYICDQGPNEDVTFVPVETPKEMTQEDINQAIEEFRVGAQNAIDAGFDMVEVHGANGYLIDQFLRSNSNKRSDSYGGSKEARIKFLLEVTQAVVKQVGADKVGVRLSPFIKFKDMDDPEILDTIEIASKKLNELNISYIHLCEADWADAPSIPEGFREKLRSNFKKTIIATGNKTPEQGEELLEGGLVDLIGFGRLFISNPDLPRRIKENLPLAEITDTHGLFGKGTEKGYSDYPPFK